MSNYVVSPSAVPGLSFDGARVGKRGFECAGQVVVTDRTKTTLGEKKKTEWPSKPAPIGGYDDGHRGSKNGRANQGLSRPAEEESVWTPMGIFYVGFRSTLRKVQYEERERG
jgi:hypothetical protein